MLVRPRLGFYFIRVFKRVGHFHLAVVPQFWQSRWESPTADPPVYIYAMVVTQIIHVEQLKHFDGHGDQRGGEQLDVYADLEGEPATVTLVLWLMWSSSVSL